MLILLAVILGGALYWFRGRGGWGIGTQGNRLVWSLPTGALLWWCSGMPLGPWYVLVCALAAFAALVVTGHGEHQDMGRMPPGYSSDGADTEYATFWLPQPDMSFPAWQREAMDAGGMAVIGAVRMAVMALPVVYWWPPFALLPLVGVLQAGCYWVGWRIYERTGRRDPLEWSEALWGAAQWAAIMAMGP